MNDTWIKLYRKITESDVFQDARAFQVFIWLLISADHKTGKIKVGRFWLANLLDMNPNTLKDVVKRLEKKYKIITTTSTSKFTEITLLNWAKYQSRMIPTPLDDTSPTPAGHQQNTSRTPLVKNKEYKNKEIRNIYSDLEYLREIPESDIEEYYKKYEVTRGEVRVLAEKLYLWCVTENESKKNYRTFIMNRLLDKYGFRSTLQVKAHDVPEEISQEVRDRNREQLAKMKAGLLTTIGKPIPDIDENKKRAELKRQAEMLN